MWYRFNQINQIYGKRKSIRLENYYKYIKSIYIYIYIYNNGRKSKLTLFIIEALGLGFFGIDRMYTGEIGQGVFKCISFSGLGLWAIIDYIIVLINTISKSEEGVFGVTKWSDDVNYVGNIALIILLFQLIIIPLIGSIIPFLFYNNYKKLENNNQANNNQDNNNQDNNNQANNNQDNNNQANNNQDNNNQDNNNQEIIQKARLNRDNIEGFQF